MFALSIDVGCKITVGAEGVALCATLCADLVSEDDDVCVCSHVLSVLASERSCGTGCQFVRFLCVLVTIYVLCLLKGFSTIACTTIDLVLDTIVVDTVVVGNFVSMASLSLAMPG